MSIHLLEIDISKSKYKTDDDIIKIVIRVATMAKIFEIWLKIKLKPKTQ